MHTEIIKKIDNSLHELRLFFGSGYRIYFIEKNNQIIILLNGGNKSSQNKDIKKAKELINQIETEQLYEKI